MSDVLGEIDDLLNQVKTTASTANKMAFLILCGEADDDLDVIEMAVKQRRIDSSGVPSGSVGIDSDLTPLSIGDKIFFNNQCSPQYLRGATGRVVGKYGKKVRVEVDDQPQAKRFSGRTTLVPSSVISKVVS